MLPFSADLVWVSWLRIVYGCSTRYTSIQNVWGWCAVMVALLFGFVPLLIRPLLLLFWVATIAASRYHLSLSLSYFFSLSLSLFLSLSLSISLSPSLKCICSLFVLAFPLILATQSIENDDRDHYYSSACNIPQCLPGFIEIRARDGTVARHPEATRPKSDWQIDVFISPTPSSLSRLDLILNIA